MLKLFLWLRYLRKKKIVFLSIAAVGLSVALMMVVDSLFTGFIDALKENIAADSGDIIVWPRGKPIPEYNIFLDRLEELQEIEAAAPYLPGGGLLHLETGDVREVAVEGIDINREIKFTGWLESLLRQKGSSEKLGFEVPNFPNDNGCWVGVSVVAEPNEETDRYDYEQIKEWIGKKVTLITTGLVKVKAGEVVDESGQNKTIWEKKLKRRRLKLRISDVAFTKTYAGDRKLYLPFDLWHKLQFGEDETGQARNIKIKLKDGSKPEYLTGKIINTWEIFAGQQLGWKKSDIPPLAIRSKEDFGRDYFAELHKQMRILLLIFGVICSVAVLLVFCIFYMIVETRQKDIAIIKSCGTSSRSVAFIFAGFGGCVGIAGSILGIFLGFIVTRNINAIEHWIRIVFGLKLWQSSAYKLNQIPHQVDWMSLLWILPAAVLGCLIGALIPAIVAARTKPVEILRYE